ncbi:hypothetical protein CO726_24705 [Bacillus fungorum]|uniref:Uncharacterized protein n=1 Tax=Bacillus fungorum TaxID=2039284 RepID=A0A2G6Q8R4_9BACI|nr:hypothetical protein [Bacillus fungorum]PIE92770.1 hypothetical protein CO726_24705 [Bacillus fungorum]
MKNYVYTVLMLIGLFTVISSIFSSGVAVEDESVSLLTSQVLAELFESVGHVLGKWYIAFPVLICLTFALYFYVSQQFKKFGMCFLATLMIPTFYWMFINLWTLIGEIL